MVSPSAKRKCVSWDPSVTDTLTKKKRAKIVKDASTQTDPISNFSLVRLNLNLASQDMFNKLTFPTLDWYYHMLMKMSGDLEVMRSVRLWLKSGCNHTTPSVQARVLEVYNWTIVELKKWEALEKGKDHRDYCRSILFSKSSARVVQDKACALGMDEEMNSRKTLKKE